MSGDDGKKAKQVSRAVVEFGGKGSAEIVGFRFINMTRGQVLVLAEWARLQADLALESMAMDQRADAPKIVVPRIVPPGSIRQ